jgi:hypothetical protein
MKTKNPVLCDLIECHKELRRQIQNCDKGYMLSDKAIKETVYSFFDNETDLREIAYNMIMEIIERGGYFD